MSRPLRVRRSSTYPVEPITGTSVALEGLELESRSSYAGVLADQLEGKDDLEVRTQDDEHLVLGGHTAVHRAGVAEAISRSGCAVAEGVVASAERALVGPAHAGP